MARYQHLPVYQSVYVLCLQSYRIKLKLPKSFKHDLGQAFCGQSIRLLKIIALANQHKNKFKMLEHAAIEHEGLWVITRLLFDLKCISNGEYRILCEMLTEIAKQIHAWRRWEKENQKRLPPQTP